MDRNGVGARTETESEKMGRPGDDRIRTGVDWSERGSSRITANKNMRSVVEGRGKGGRQRVCTSRGEGGRRGSLLHSN